MYIYVPPTGGAARKRPVPADVGLILQRVVAIPERISMGFRHGVPRGSMGCGVAPFTARKPLAARAAFLEVRESRKGPMVS